MNNDEKPALLCGVADGKLDLAHRAGILTSPRECRVWDDLKVPYYGKVTGHMGFIG